MDRAVGPEDTEPANGGEEGMMNDGITNVELPEGWIRAPFSAVVVDPIQRVPAENEKITYIDIGSVDRVTKKVVDPQSMIGKDAPSRARKVIQTGDVLVSTVRPNLNAVALVESQYDGQFASTGFDVLRSPVVDPRWLFYSVRTPAFLDRMSELVQGALYPAVRSFDIRSFVIPLAPIAEQKRIADKLEAVLGRVDACRARLDRVPALLKRFRQSVLAAATLGKLTEDWREGSSTVTWKSLKVSDVGSVQLGRQRAPKYHHGDNMRPYLRVQNVFEARIDLSDVMEMEFSDADYKRYKLSYGDILLNEGQSPQYLGRPAMFRDELPGACFTNSLIRFRAKLDILDREYALLVFRHYMRSGRFAKEGSITTNIAHLSAGKFANIEFSLPPLPEQQEIVRRVEALFAFADRIEARLATAQKTVERLTPATLAKAFRGELVPQDPNDEPAEALLERLRSEQGSGHVRKGRRMAGKSA